MKSRCVNNHAHMLHGEIYLLQIVSNHRENVQIAKTGYGDTDVSYMWSDWYQVCALVDSRLVDNRKHIRHIDIYLLND